MGITLPGERCARGPGPSSGLGRQLVRIPGESLAAILGHQQEVLEPDLADITLPQARLDGDHVAGDQFAMPHLTKRRILMDLESHAVAERELKALVRVLPRAGSLSAMPRGLEDLADQGVQLTSGDPGAHRLPRPPDRLAHEDLVGPHGVGDLTDNER